MDQFPGLDILLKLGENGAAYISHTDRSVLKSPAVPDHKGKNIVDTTGAGDCFTGAFSTWLSRGHSIQESMNFANIAAFLCITEFGALPAMPLIEHV